MFRTKLKIPRCMSTQHPDNVNTPFFSESSEIGGEDEIKECFYAFSHLGCDEQMWDCEGKEIDTYVVKKLITKYQSFFETHRLGKDTFLTLRVPNPTVERAEAKILIETLESIPRSFDAANLLYGDDIAPIFEVILPMTTSSKCVDRVYRYYKDFVVGKQVKTFQENDITIAEWIGKFAPDRINVIPLIEDLDHMINADMIIKDYLKDKEVEHHRVFFARSDPAMNYGLVTAVLINKIALQKIHALSEEISVDMYPIVGVGSAPFRGNLRPQTVRRVSKEYPFTHTYTVQSAFKYDNSPEDVMAGIKFLMERKTSKPRIVDELKCLDIIERYSQEYSKQIISLAPYINTIAKFIPSRRKRKLHIGLFGYSRNLGEISLPRAISFTASLYSLGIPPEILGINALSDKDIEYIQAVYINFIEDLEDALKYYNSLNGIIPAEIERKLVDFDLDYETSEKHQQATNIIVECLKKNQLDKVGEEVVIAANLRKFLG
ncbi:MAG: phosphoenolpyruvate carboxylase [Candidatus Lokiarchaeota archaeon]|nr:phosphoenolpyruvate carboxylase [Candidatus Lokiarchaeota archaeon]